MRVLGKMLDGLPDDYELEEKCVVQQCCIVSVRILFCSREKYARVRPHSERTQVEEVLSGPRRATVALALMSRALGSEQIGSVSCHGHDQVAHLRVLRLEVNG